MLSNLTEQTSGVTKQRRYVYEPGGEPQRYVIYSGASDSDDIELRVKKLMEMGKETEHVIWQFLAGVDLVCTVHWFNLPVDSPLR